MQEAMPHRTFFPATVGGRRLSSIGREAETAEEVVRGGDGGSVRSMVSENAVIVFGKRGCCMCHVVKRLLLGLGVNPAVFEINDEDEAEVIAELFAIVGGGDDGGLQLPAVFVGGKLFGGLDRVMSTHITGELVPILKQAGALWL
ncbi:Glutaredoxin [Dillenia turbinata]|uniref:Glutaredoxin n=1 Tax=Dillenia turbinata TaxID=194707 RepID=A0AAN8UXI0_9MAGN